MSCETKDGKVLSTFSGKFWELVTWVRGPACSDGIDQRCEYLGSIQKLAHEDVIVECIDRVGQAGHYFLLYLLIGLPLRCDFLDAPD